METTLNYDIANVGAQDNSTNYTTKSNDALGKDEFLQLLVTQLKYQDPLKPMDDKEFIAQMAQFSSLEQMQNLNSSYTTTKAMSLMGKYVEGTIVDGDEIKEIKGYVESVKVSGSNAYAVVDGKDVPVEDIMEIRDAEKVEEEEFVDISKYTGLIGTNINSLVNGLEEDTVFSFSGVVKSVRVIGNEPLAVINDIKTTIDSLILSDEEKGDVTTVKEYLEGKIGEEVSAIISNEYGEKTQITGILNSVTGDVDNPEVIFDEVNASVESIYEIY